MAAEAPRTDPRLRGLILISACLVGHKVRYDGGHQRLGHPLIDAWDGAGRLVPCCPEVLGGLPIPRPPAEIQGGDGKAVLGGRPVVRTAAGEDVTQPFARGAAAALEMAQAQGIRFAILCQRSPSCGSRQIYNGRFEGTLVPGMGVTTALLRAHGITVFSPEELAVASAAAAAAERLG
jgi:uncharacterized protein YbbK (DUF523 family)